MNDKLSQLTAETIKQADIKNLIIDVEVLKRLDSSDMISIRLKTIRF